MIKKAFPLTS